MKQCCCFLFLLWKSEAYPEPCEMWHICSFFLIKKKNLFSCIWYLCSVTQYSDRWTLTSGSLSFHTESCQPVLHWLAWLIIPTCFALCVYVHADLITPIVVFVRTIVWLSLEGGNVDLLHWTGGATHQHGRIFVQETLNLAPNEERNLIKRISGGIANILQCICRSHGRKKDAYMLSS